MYVSKSYVATPFSPTSSLITYSNSKNAILRNGYISPDSNLIERSKIILHDEKSTYGTFAYDNFGTIQNVYNLVDIEFPQSSYSGNGYATIATVNNVGALIKNTISVATTTQIEKSNAMLGPNIISNRGIASNNYYVDTNKGNVTYSGNFNKKINIATLMNKNSWEIILNGDNAFSIIDGYYPILKMNDFMKNSQKLIQITGQQIGESKIDVWSSENIYNNISEKSQNREGKVKVYISNPHKYEITNVEIEGLHAEINKNGTCCTETNNVGNCFVKEDGTCYDESMQATVLELDLELGADDIAKSNYNIVSLSYKDDLGGEHIIQYDDNNFRTIDIEMYRIIDNYADLIKSINRNENIYLNSDIEFDQNIFPSNSETYSAIFDGNEKSLNFSNKPIVRSYFMFKVTGIIKNLRVVGMNLHSLNSPYIGFIHTLNSGTISNVDISDSVIEIFDTGNYDNIYIGGVVAYSTNSLIEKVSTNNFEITKHKGNINSIIKYRRYITSCFINYAYSFEKSYIL